jgi:hypothetical protein
VSQLVVDNMPFELCEEFDKLNLRIVVNTKAMEMEVGSSLHQEIRRGQLEDEKVQEIKCIIKEEKLPGFLEDDEGVLWYKGRICVPNVKELKDKILHEAHESAYSIHPGGNKMYHDFKATCRAAPWKLPMEDLDAKKDISYQEYHVKILETSERVTRNNKIGMCKVQWSHHTEEEATWEREEELKAEFSSFFSDPSESQGRDSF